MKILFVGLGGIGQRHLRNVRAKFGDSVEVLAYRVRKLTTTVSPTLSVEEGVDVNEKYGVHVYTDLKEALAQKPEIAFICNPSSLHIPVAIEAAKAGCHIFLEKPVSHNLEGADELLALVQEKKLTCLVGYQLRFHPCILKTKELLDQNAIGSLLSLHAEVGEYLPGWHKYEDYRQMYASRKDQGGGVVLSQIHELDYLYSWFGLPKKICAIGGHVSSLEIDVEDTAKVLLEVEHQGRNVPISLHMDYNQKPPSRFCKIVGEQGKIMMDLAQSKVILMKSDGEEPKFFDFSQFERNQLFTGELDHFFNCVEGKEKPVVSLQDGLNSLKMALSIKQSMKENTVVALEG